MPRATSDKILVYGCGDLAWGRQASSRFGGSDWEPGGLPEPVPLDPQAGDGAALAASLTDVLDGEVGWPASRTPGDVKVTVQPGSGAGELRVPSWEELVARQVREITRMLGGSGVLVTPERWFDSRRGHDFLRAWAQEGWQWARLEEVLRPRFPDLPRFVSAGRNWLRICERAGSAVVANGAEAACALALAPKILDAVLTQVNATLASDWRREEENQTSWLVRQQIAQVVAAAYSDGRRSCELGTPAVPLFFFSSQQARAQFRELAELRVTVELPAMPYASWWEQIANPDFLPAPAGTHRRPALRWDDLETVLLAHPESGNRSSRAEIRSLYDYLRFNGRPHRLVDPATLKEALTMGMEIEPLLARMEKDERPPTPAVAQVSAETSEAAPQIAKEAGTHGAPRGATPAYSAHLAENSPQFSTSWEVEKPGEPEPRPTELTAADLAIEPVIERVMPVAPDPLLGFRPDAFFLGEGYEPDRLSVWLDGQPVDSERLRLKRVELAPGQRGFRFEDLRVGHGAIVRVDFEPIPARSEEPEALPGGGV